jgi:hypothetical protein
MQPPEEAMRNNKPYPPVTREEIIARLDKGPTQFLEFAKTKKHGSVSRTVAAELCKALEQAGAIRLVYIGHYKYFILDTEQGRSQAIRQQIEENSRIDPVTGCTIWTSYSDPLRGPVMRQNIIGAYPLNVRRWLWEQKHGPLETLDLVKMKCTCEHGCVDVGHMLKTDRSAIQRGKKKSMQQRIRLSKSISMARAGAYQHVEMIRASEKTNAELAKELGMTASNVSMIRRGDTFKHHPASAGGLSLMVAAR